MPRDETDIRRPRHDPVRRGLRIKSVFTAHRELGGFFVGDPRLEAAARRGFERLLQVGALLGADYIGSNPGAGRRVVHSHENLLLAGLPLMCEFHFKNTDAIYGATFGFGPEEAARGVVDLARLKRLCDEQASRWPMTEVVGNLEIAGPKLGRAQRPAPRAGPARQPSRHPPPLPPHPARGRPPHPGRGAPPS